MHTVRHVFTALFVGCCVLVGTGCERRDLSKNVQKRAGDNSSKPPPNETSGKSIAPAMMTSERVEQQVKLFDAIPDESLKLVEVKKKLQEWAVSDLDSAVELANWASSWMNPSFIALSFQRANQYPPEDFQNQFVPKFAEVLKSNLTSQLKDQLVTRYAMACAGSTTDIERLIGITESLYKMSPEATAQVYQDYARASGAKAISALNSKNWSPDLAKATAVAYATYAMEDSVKASEYVKLQKGHDNYDWAVAGLYQVVRAVDPESAKIWRSEIKSTEAQAAADSTTYSIQIKK